MLRKRKRLITFVHQEGRCAWPEKERSLNNNKGNRRTILALEKRKQVEKNTKTKKILASMERGWGVFGKPCVKRPMKGVKSAFWQIQKGRFGINHLCGGGWTNETFQHRYIDTAEVFVR